MVVPGTPRDSLYILDCLINLDAGPKPELVTTDQASDSDMVFGIFSMLGYRFAPRFADLGDQRFWRAELPDGSTGDYGVLEAIARNKLATKKVITQWPDMLRVAGSLVTNQVRAYDLLRMFARQGSPTPLGQAFAEYGRIDKTMHLLSMLDPMDSSYRRSLGKQLSVQESQHRLARKICHGNSGRIRQAYRPRRINSRLLDLSSMPSCCGTHGICRRSWTGCAPRVCRSRTRTWHGCPRWATPTSTAWAATRSLPRPRTRACGRSARRRCPRSVRPAPLSWTMTVSEPLTDDRLNDGPAHGPELFHLRVSQKRQWCSVEPSPLLRAEERERTWFALLLVRGFHRGRLGSLGLPVAAKRVQ